MTTKDIVNLLHKSIINHTYDMVPTVKNRETKRKYGFSQIDIEYIMLTITEDNLYKGPVTDYDRPNEQLYMFKKRIKNSLVFYIKIKEENINHDKIIKILSCHDDEGKENIYER